MPWNKHNTEERWSEPKELFPGVFERVKYNPETGRLENIIYKKGEERHFHGWIDLRKNDAGGEFNRNKSPKPGMAKRTTPKKHKRTFKTILGVAAIILVLLVILMILTEGSALAPFIYTLF